jgi:multisubunit Na+/H+ antiporter MnhC subunit
VCSVSFERGVLFCVMCVVSFVFYSIVMLVTCVAMHVIGLSVISDGVLSYIYSKHLRKLHIESET